uniref:Sucrose operon repressor n=1 Tax=Vibrio alginolyticus TaxID=663 RepID=SCRR_VIBAL|nr:RecName: Full=Sucrose operon repressor; AltName: Full=Scr operon regulatory protein [Vibrio alginolyticus]AAA27558.1 Scr repressor protein (scrR) [Vibrio alginolyticus]
MASLHDVARLAGVSKSTVSRVINDEYGVKEATKQKVRQAVAECGYVPNQVAKDLKEESSAIIVQDKTGKVLFVKEGALEQDEIAKVIELIKQNI